MSMKQTRILPYPGQGSKQRNSESDEKHLSDKSSDFPEQDESFETVGMNLQSSLTRKFPELLFGKTFFEKASEHLEAWSSFDAMVIRPDPAEDGESKADPINSVLIHELADSVDAVCKIHPCFWGMYGADCIACFVEIKDGNDGFGIADIIRKAMKKRSEGTFSIGIAAYPQLSYNKDEIVENAFKALEHASFLGRNSTVRFDAVSLNISGDKLYQEGNVDSAIAEFEKALLMDPQNVNVRNSLGVCYSSKDEHQNALVEFKKVMILDPEDLMAPYNAGLAYMMTGDEEKALEMFLQAHSLDKNQFEVLIQLGRLYLEMKHLESAREYLEKAAEINKESGSAHRFLGECYSDLKMFDEAIEAYSKAVKINGNDANSLSALACLYAGKKINKEIAVVFARQSVYLSPSTALFHKRLGEVYYLQDRLEEALQAFKTASELGHDCRSCILEIENRLLPDINWAKKI